MKNIPGSFSSILEAVWQNSHSLAIAIIRQGEFISLSPAMKFFLAFDPYKREKKHEFINPDVFHLGENKPDGQIFKGILTIGNRSDISYSLDAQIFKEGEYLLILAEPDIEQLYRENLGLSDLNREVNRLQRELLKEKRKLSEANKVLQYLNEEKNRYVGMVAHDLIGPIGLAGGYAGLILSNYSNYSPETMLKFVKKIKISCDHSVDLIKDVLNISKIESGKFELRLEEHDYRAFLEEAVAFSELMTKNKGIGIEINEGPDHRFRFDKEKITQVMSNLLSNSIKFSPRGSSINIKYARKGGFMETSITDQGQGIPSEEIKDLFHPFKTTSVRATENEKSTGLGLAIVHKIIDAHKGKIDVFSKVGEGTTIIFSLPIDL